MVEYWDLYDISLKHTGKIHKRGERLPEGYYHIVVEIWTTDGKGNLLLTKRSPEKEPFPNLWECTGGSLVAGEEPIYGALRELFEETGIRANKDELVFLGHTDGTKSPNNRIYFNYLLTKNVSLGEIVLQQGETCDAQWVTAEEYEKMKIQELIAPSTSERYVYFDINDKLKEI